MNQRELWKLFGEEKAETGYSSQPASSFQASIEAAVVFQMRPVHEIGDVRRRQSRSQRRAAFQKSWRCGRRHERFSR
jgi:hypothetical protein